MSGLTSSQEFCMKKSTWLLALAITTTLAACSSDRPAPTVQPAKSSTASAPAVKPAPLPRAPVDITPELRTRLDALAAKVFTPDTTVSEVGVTPLGLIEFVVHGNVFYATEDLNYFIQGNILNVETMSSLTDATRTKLRQVAMKEINEADTIAFPATGDKSPKYKVTVFTDVDCGYCRKLHEERDQYAAQGIELHYLPWPRSGSSEDEKNVTGLKMRQVWCSKDRAEGLTDSKAGKDLSKVKVEAECAAPVAKYFELGQRIGINGTPAIYAEDGTQLGGYIPADRMREVLDAKAKEKAEASAPPAP